MLGSWCASQLVSRRAGKIAPSAKKGEQRPSIVTTNILHIPLCMATGCWSILQKSAGKVRVQSRGSVIHQDRFAQGPQTCKDVDKNSQTNRG